MPFRDIAGRHLVVEEKIDGANCGISFSPEGELLLQSRGHYLTGGAREKHFNLLKQWASTHAAVLHERLGDRYVLYGEWLYAKHMVFYDALPHYFLEFDILDIRDNTFLSTPRRVELLASLPVVSMPVLHEGKLKRLKELTDAEGKQMESRRITIELKTPTRNGETEIHLLTNLPAKAANARSVANLYLHRWTVEKAFHELDQALNGEIKTLGYPGAALLSFCVALLTYNGISVVKSAMAAAHGAKAKRESISGYYLAGELAAAYHGMMIAVPPAEWTRHFASLTPAELACILKALAAKVCPERFRKNVRGPKKPRPKRTSAKRHPHVSTARLIAQRKHPKTHAVAA